MKISTTSYNNLNNGKETKIYFPLSENEFKSQFFEVFEMEHYKDGKVKDGVYVDIGANIGLTALYFKEYAKKYYAIDPSSQCFTALKENTKDLNINLFNFAISTINGSEFMWQTQQDSVPQSFF